MDKLLRSDPAINPFDTRLDNMTFHQIWRILTNASSRQSFNGSSLFGTAPDLYFTEDLFVTNDNNIACDAFNADIETHLICMMTSIAVIVFGLLGNGLSMAVFLSRDMMMLSSNVYLFAIAFSDLFYLLSVFCSKVLTHLSCWLHPSHLSIDIFNTNDYCCKILQYLLDLLSDFSTCLVVALTVDRIIACYRPHSFKTLCTNRRAICVSFSIFIVIAISIIPHHFLFIGLPYDFEVCTVLVQYEHEFTILYLAESLVYRVIPIVSIIIMNMFIICKVSGVSVHRRHSKRKQYQNIPKSPNTPNRDSKMKTNRDSKNRQLTISLVVVSSFYVITFLPVLVHFLIWKLNRGGILDIPEYQLDLFQSCGQLLYITGFALNIILYTISGQNFRNRLKSIIICLCCCFCHICNKCPCVTEETREQSCSQIMKKRKREEKLEVTRMTTCKVQEQEQFELFCLNDVDDA